ncbi:MAG: DUF2199 domain-containing protein [Actinophytocola sp.]|uniref:DUF2199 domain-containing protein n=1 Tax=Actinophytocola sp. TaxID=1872138 RepID=UPI00132B1A1B|nr:DUF2199 domain-containing protein [Actinophytocola sp.]MPZ84866.1 DUF2199 domain-containing protein [Actinophytocola sp.]
MSGDLGFRCSRCGEHHATPPLSFHSEAPDYWTPDLAANPDSDLSSDQCVINGEHFFIRGLIEIPILETDNVFAWGAWVSLNKTSFARAQERWNEVGREDDAPYFGWLSTELTSYTPTTINLKTNLHTRPVGLRPFIELEPTDHPLAVDQRTGITRARVQQIAVRLLHSRFPDEGGT